MCNTSADVCSDANATGDAFPAALVSLAIAPAVAMPAELAPNAGVANVSVAAAAPGEPMDDVLMRKTSLEPAASSWSTTAFVARSLLAVE